MTSKYQTPKLEKDVAMYDVDYDIRAYAKTLIEGNYGMEVEDLMDYVGLKELPDTPKELLDHVYNAVKIPRHWDNWSPRAYVHRYFGRLENMETLKNITKEYHTTMPLEQIEGFISNYKGVDAIADFPAFAVSKNTQVALKENLPFLRANRRNQKRIVSYF